MCKIQGKYPSGQSGGFDEPITVAKGIIHKMGNISTIRMHNPADMLPPALEKPLYNPGVNIITLVSSRFASCRSSLMVSYADALAMASRVLFIGGQG